MRAHPEIPDSWMDMRDHEILFILSEIA